MATRCRIAEAAAVGGCSSLIVCADANEIAAARALLILQSGASASAIPHSMPIWRQPCLVLPPILRRSSRETLANCMAVFYALRQPGAHCLVASAESLNLRQIPLDFFDERTFDLQAGMDFAQELILEQALEWGYERVPMVARPGDMALRGDILDIFLPGYSKPVRLEFFGDTLEEIRLFDAETQRSLQGLDEVTVLPVLPVTLSSKDVETGRSHVERLMAEGRLSENEAYSLSKALDARCTRGILPGVFYERATCLEEWFSREALWLLPGRADSEEALREDWLYLKSFLEDEAAALPQPAALALRSQSLPQPWQGRPCIMAEPLVLGVEHHGRDLHERPLHSFDDLFPVPGAQDRPWQHLSKALAAWQTERRQVILSFSSERGRRKFLELAAQDGIRPRERYALDEHGLFALVSPFRSGIDLVWDNSLILGEDILYPKAQKAPRSPSRAFKGLDSFDSLKEGDLLVHRDYGIGRFAGLHHLSLTNVANDFLLIEYSGNDKLYVPADRLSLIQRFKGAEGFEPALDRLGGTGWSTGREKAKKAIEKIAADLVEMYAYRKVAKGFRYMPVSDLYHEFEATFGFDETPDQAKAIQDVLDDMEKPQPMDRLVCGDVGFGKTEVALRAAFRAASESRQTVILCPTTVLAEQHYQSFRARLAGFPVTVGLLSRFVPKARQKEVLAQAAKGQIDILVGTHRLLSKDVSLPNLSLLILDEEQHFGVRHKERLKALKKNVDVLTLTATPIPRTLQLSMSGIRDLSLIETAPQDRKPVATAVLQRNDATLKSVIERELARKGQIFWVYNRVQGLARVADYVRRLVPEARIGMAHGQLTETELEDTMHKFWHGDLDVLVCTSIVESGLDFPRANTLVVDQAQMFGLGQLYQLRGRVGRSDEQAYAIFIVPDCERLSPIAEERLRIIMDMDYLGAGFQLAMEDLRLRGAGNILGEVQSGHMSRVGLDLYLEMLEQAVARLKGMPETAPAETELNLGLPAHIPQTYIDDGKLRLNYYKALTSAADGPAREAISLEMRDRFGTLPPEFDNFMAVLDFKQFAASLQIQRADIYQDHISLSWADGQTAVQPEKLIALIHSVPGAKVHPPAGLTLPLAEDVPFSRALAAVQEALGTARTGK
ncbi:MAG: transcription-repair coupling factor [Desulfovibrio sp.]|nr:transcription-repair coupling factor [Desulfovibrio sp.]